MYRENFEGAIPYCMPSFESHGHGQPCPQVFGNFLTYLSPASTPGSGERQH